jgi:hypothetical protein
MNWYRRFAIFLFLLGFASVAAIWVFDPSDVHYKQIDLTLIVAAAIRTISGICLAIVGAAHKRPDHASPKLWRRWVVPNFRFKGWDDVWLRFIQKPEGTQFPVFTF